MKSFQSFLGFNTVMMFLILMSLLIPTYASIIIGVVGFIYIVVVFGLKSNIKEEIFEYEKIKEVVEKIIVELDKQGIKLDILEDNKKIVDISDQNENLMSLMVEVGYVDENSTIHRNRVLVAVKESENLPTPTEVMDIIKDLNSIYMLPDDFEIISINKVVE